MEQLAEVGGLLGQEVARLQGRGPGGAAGGPRTRSPGGWSRSYKLACHAPGVVDFEPAACACVVVQVPRG